jgi:hypothetical protein
MKWSQAVVATLFVSAVVLGSAQLVSAETAAKELVIADFDSGSKPNNIGGDFGAWNRDPEDNTQSCTMTFESQDAVKPEGYSLRLNYDVDSPNPAYNGFWMKLEGEDVSQYNTLNFYIKGDKTKGFTDKVKVELKNFERSSPYIVRGVTDQWQKVSIPLEKFSQLKDLTSMSEFVVVFDDINSNPKSGSVFIDNISFSKE